jgi:hypothetical protein
MVSTSISEKIESLILLAPWTHSDYRAQPQQQCSEQNKTKQDSESCRRHLYRLYHTNCRTSTLRKHSRKRTSSCEQAGTCSAWANQHFRAEFTETGCLECVSEGAAKRGELFRRLLPMSPEDKVLDLGGGDGSHIAAILPEHRNIWVADIDPRALEKAA